MKVPILMISPATCYLICILDPNILISTLFSYTLNLRSSLTLRDQVSHPYKTTCKNIILHIFIFAFLGDWKTELCAE